MSLHHFQAMGCEIVVGGGSPREREAIKRLFDLRERAFSRFIPDSELNRVNASAGRLASVSELFAGTLQIALQAAHETEGLVRPTLGAELEGAGYTRDFSDLVPDWESAPESGGGASGPVIVLGRLVGVPPRARLNLNGVVKSLAVDDALRLFSGRGFVSAGGDLMAGMHLTSSPIDWYAARAGGVAAYVLLSAVVALGLAMVGKKSMKRWPRFAFEDVHRFGGLLVGTFVVIHIVAVAIDAYLPFSLTSLLVPLTARYRPVWTGLGVVAAELLLALAFTNHYQNRLLSYRFWRRAHYLNFAVWSTATLHGLGSGTDRNAPWLLGIYVTAVGTVSALIAWRMLRIRRPSPTLLRAGPVAMAVAMMVLVAVLALGPFRFRPKPWNAMAFRDHLKGQILTDAGVTKGIISMAGTGTGPQTVIVRADLLVSTRQLVSTHFQMEYVPRAVCRGEVTHVHSYGFEATCHLGHGPPRFVRGKWLPTGARQIQGGVITSHE